MSATGYGIANAAQQSVSGMSPQMSMQQLGSMANQMFTSEYNTYRAQQTQAALWNQAMSQGLARQQHQWMINGVTMTFDQFLDELAPGEDNPMRTFLILKYKK